MLSREIKEKRGQLQIISMDDFVPANHILRKIDRNVSFEFIYDLVKDKYCENNGRPSVDPVVLFKIVFIQYLFGIRSMRQTVMEIETNIAYRWFLGYDMQDSIPHFSTFGKNYARRFAETDIFEQIFSQILQQAVNLRIVDPSAVFIDSTHVRANANKKKKIKQQIGEQAKLYQKELDEEIAASRELHEQKPLKDKPDDDANSGGGKEIEGSSTDPECGMFHKGEHEKQFAYTVHTACDKHNFILGAIVSPANVHDSVMFQGVYDKVKTSFQEIEAVVLDAGYRTPYIAKQILQDGRIPVMAYKRPMSKEGYFRPHEYHYDEALDAVICPWGEVLNYSTTNRDGYKEYRSKARVCKNCPCRMQCTQSKNGVKIVTRHVWQGYLDTAEAIRHVPEFKELYAMRKEKIERVFADAKVKHGMRYTQYRGKAKVTMQALLTFTCMNMKKLAAWADKPRPTGPETGLLSSSLCLLIYFHRFCLHFIQNKPRPAFA